MADFPKREHSMRDIRRAGELLKGTMLWTPETEETAKEAFHIAQNWRDSHAYPMGKIRSELVGRVRSLSLKGITAARLKRMPSIRRKLRVIRENLSQIQDLGGCRVVLPSVADVRAFVDSHRGDNKHEFDTPDDYIQAPKRGGYRSYHVVCRFKGVDGATIFDGRRIEIQVRTRLQHSWATAVEAVGTFRREDLKAGVGDGDWLRLFELMSSEFAMAENSPLVPQAPDDSARRKEIKDLNKKLGALAELEKLRQAVRFTDDYIHDPKNMPQYYLIRYDNQDRQVEARPYFRALDGAASYDEIEQADRDSTRFNTVLVEFAAIEQLKEAFPNYFGDVRLFTANLERITTGGVAEEYTAPPVFVPPPSNFKDADISWLRRTGVRRYPQGPVNPTPNKFLGGNRPKPKRDRS